MALGFIMNFMNPDGIPLIREKAKLNWAADSIIINDEFSEQTNTDEVDTIKSISSSDKTSNKSDEIKTDLSESASQHIVEVKQNKNETEIKSETEIVYEPKAITLSQAYSLYNANGKFIDARESYDYKEGHITGAINIPYYEFEEYKNKLENLSKDDPVVTYCSGTDCELSILLGNQLSSMGYKKVFIFFGGWPEWTDANYPVTLNNISSD